MSRHNRPLSPHLSVYRWRANMLVSILHRVTGSALAIGSLIILWGLFAVAEGQVAFQNFTQLLSSPWGRLIMFGFSWAFLQHMMSGLRHLYMDTGAGFEVMTARRSAILTMLASFVATLLLWFYGYGLI